MRVESVMNDGEKLRKCDLGRGRVVVRK
jgi:hypothetical protein